MILDLSVVCSYTSTVYFTASYLGYGLSCGTKPCGTVMLSLFQQWQGETICYLSMLVAMLFYADNYSLFSSHLNIENV